MCWQAAIPLLTSAAGAYAQNQSQTDMLRQQDRAAAAGIMRQATLSREADTKVAQNVQQLSASNPEADIAARRAAYTDALRRAAPTRAGATPVSGNVSSRFAGDVEATNADTEKNAANEADLTARIEAPQYQRSREGVAANNTAVDLSLLRGRSQGQDYLTRLKMAMAKGNPWMTAGGQVLTGIGGGLATNTGWDAGSIDPLTGMVGDGTIAPVKVKQRKV